MTVILSLYKYPAETNKGGEQRRAAEILVVAAQILDKHAMLEIDAVAMNCTVLRFATLREGYKNTWRTTLNLIKVKLWRCKYTS